MIQFVNKSRETNFVTISAGTGGGIVIFKRRTDWRRPQTVLLGASSTHNN